MVIIIHVSSTIIPWTLCAISNWSIAFWLSHCSSGELLQAKDHCGQWLIRIDDIDPPRELKGAADDIIKTLEGFGFEWDEEVYYQSKRLDRYQEAVSLLVNQQHAYPCSCSRKSILEKTGQIKGKGEIIYPGFCRNGPLVNSENPANYSIRLRCNKDLISHNDAVQGKQETNLETQVGDFIIQRREQYFSYQLATGIDDAEQNITEVVRGADLLNCTPCQQYVQQTLNLNTPQYCHLPVVVNKAGRKLSKQSHAEPIKINDSVVLLYKTLKFLGQMPPNNLIDAHQEDVWNWAKSNWRLDLVPKNTTNQRLESRVNGNSKKYSGT